MLGHDLAAVFANAAIPQKIMLALLLAAIPATLLATVLARGSDGVWRGFVEELRMAGPALGLLVGAMNAFHMAQSIQRAPFDPTAKQLAPGVFEIATLVGLGALVGLVATAAHAGLRLRRA